MSVIFVLSLMIYGFIDRGKFENKVLSKSYWRNILILITSCIYMVSPRWYNPPNSLSVGTNMVDLIPGSSSKFGDKPVSIWFSCLVNKLDFKNGSYCSYKLIEHNCMLQKHNKLTFFLYLL